MNRYRHDPDTPTHLRRLVDSAHGDGLDAEARRRVAERLGIAPVTRAPTEPESAPLKSSRPWLSFGTVTVTAVALLGGTAGYSRMAETAPRARTSSDPAFAAVAPPVAKLPAAETGPASVAPPSTGMASVNVAALPDVRTDSNARPSRASASASALPGRTGAPSQEGSDLRREIAALDAVRRATESGAPREALKRLDEYTRSFPAAKLREEAVVLRIEALGASGDHVKAESLAHRLFLESPSTPYAARVRAALVNPSRE